MKRLIGDFVAVIAVGVPLFLLILILAQPSQAINTSQDGFWHTITLTRGGKEYQVDVWCRIPLPTKEAPQKTILWTPPQP